MARFSDDERRRKLRDTIDDVYFEWHDRSASEEFIDQVVDAVLAAYTNAPTETTTSDRRTV